MGWIDHDDQYGWDDWDARHFVVIPDCQAGSGKERARSGFPLKLMREDGRDGGLRKLLDQLITRVGPIPASLASMVSLAGELFTLSEGLQLQPSILPIQNIWTHSLRTGYLAALITEAHGARPPVIWQAFAGGLLHDIGLLLLLIQESPTFFRVVELASIRGTDLQVLERECYGTTHAELGAALLARWGGCSALVNTVHFHDDPFRNAEGQFCPASAVFLANILDGGGVAQDSDGILSVEGEAYLLRLGLLEYVPYWQGRMRDIQNVAI